MLRVLKPGGRLGLIRNLRDAASAEWVARLDAIVNRVEGHTPRHYTDQCRSAFPFAGFGPLHEQRFVQDHTGWPENVIVARVKSTSSIVA